MSRNHENQLKCSSNSYPYVSTQFVSTQSVQSNIRCPCARKMSLKSLYYSTCAPGLMLMTFVHRDTKSGWWRLDWMMSYPMKLYKRMIDRTVKLPPPKCMKHYITFSHSSLTSKVQHLLLSL